MAFINFSRMVLSVAMVGLFTQFGAEGILYKPTSDGVSELRSVRQKKVAKEVEEKKAVQDHEDVKMTVTADGTTTTTPAPLGGLGQASHEVEELHDVDEHTLAQEASAAARHPSADLMLVQEEVAANSLVEEVAASPEDAAAWASQVAAKWAAKPKARLLLKPKEITSRQ